MTHMQVREESQEGAQPRRILGLRHTRTCRMSDDVLAVRITPDGRLLALALLDSTVQVGNCVPPKSLGSPEFSGMNKSLDTQSYMLVVACHENPWVSSHRQALLLL